MGDNESNRGHWEAMGDKGRQELAKADAPSNTGTHMRGDNGETRPREGEHTFQHRHTCATMGDNGRQGETRPLGKADTASNTGLYVGRQWETRPREGGHTIQHRHTCGEIMGGKGGQWETRGGKTSGRRA